MFHVRDGLYFERLEGRGASQAMGRRPAESMFTDDLKLMGGVHIVKRSSAAESAPIVFEAWLTPGEWASVVASVSALGENCTTWHMLRALQRGAY